MSGLAGVGVAVARIEGKEGLPVVGGVVVVGLAGADEADRRECGLEVGDGLLLAGFGFLDEAEEFGTVLVPCGFHLGDLLGDVARERGADGADVLHLLLEDSDGGVDLLGLDAAEGLVNVGCGEGMDDWSEGAARAFHVRGFLSWWYLEGIYQ